MRHRIRAAALLVRDDALLLVEHVHPVTGETWWVPPGGGVEERDESIFDCVVREVREETGLTVTATRIAYVREFLDRENGALNLELFVLAEVVSGTLTICGAQGNGPDEHYIKDVRYMTAQEMNEITVYPEMLGTTFWTDREGGFPDVRYLGRQSD